MITAQEPGKDTTAEAPRRYGLFTVLLLRSFCADYFYTRLIDHRCEPAIVDANISTAFYTVAPLTRISMIVAGFFTCVFSALFVDFHAERDVCG